MLRTIEGFHQDDEDDWVAELSCLHGQHVRHRPPFRDQPWVLDPAGRAARVGAGLDCPLCDRAELPDGLVTVRTAGPFDAATIPAGLRREHRVAERTWARVHVVGGSVRLTIDTDPPLDVRLAVGDEQPIPPAVPHALHVEGPVTLVVEFLVRKPS